MTKLGVVRCIYETQEVSEVFDKFKEFEAVTTSDARETIGTLRTDNGGAE